MERTKDISKWIRWPYHINNDTKCIWRVLCLVAQLCLTFWDAMDCSPPGSSVYGDSLGKNTGVGCCALLQVIFPTQGSNSGLPHRQILYCLSHQWSLKILEWIAYPFSRGTSRPRNQTGLLHCRQILYQLSYQGSPYVNNAAIQYVSYYLCYAGSRIDAIFIIPC